MRLEKLAYSQFVNSDNEWKFEECNFDEVNLIVGKNATGKTRTLNIIRGLAAILTDNNELQWVDGKYHVEFIGEDNIYIYDLEYHENNIVSEELKVNGTVKLTRTKDGSGKLFADKLDEDIDFKTDTRRVAVSTKRDAIQHAYLEELYSWANGVIRYNFNSKLGKEMMLSSIKNKDERNLENSINIKDTDKAISIFLLGKKKYGKRYKQEILDDLMFLEYGVTDVGVAPLEGLIIQETLPKMPYGLYVQEADLKHRTNQIEMSDGMFRAFSVLLQVNYALLSKQTTCLLIDDIGEGLDYSRSSALVKRLVEKAKGSSIQLIMTTNDRFIMNAVPLENWIVLVRNGGRIKNLTYLNSKELIDEFAKTGLNNFDFFSSEYYLRK